MIAWVGSTPGFQADTVPSSVAQMNTAGFCGASRKSVGVPLNTMPVGVPVPDCDGAAGIVTMIDRTVTGLVDASYTVDVPVALLETHHGVEGPCTTPHAFLRLGSV